MQSLLNRNGKTNKIFSSAITLLVIGLLVFVGPVNALNLEVSGFRSGAYNLGEVINFIGSVDIESNEILPLSNVSLEINGEVVCTTDVWGWILSGCQDMSMQLLQYATTYDYGYGYNTFGYSGNGSYAGYGYGYHLGKTPGRIAYNITIQTNHSMLFLSGGNKIKFIVNTPTQTLESNAGTVLITPLQPLSGSGNFSMITDSSDMTITGTYDSSVHSLEGFLYFAGFTDPLYAVAGDYNPITPTSGDIEFRLYDITRIDDVGVIWEGNYSSGRWYIRPEGYPLTSWIEGDMLVAPQ